MLFAVYEWSQPHVLTGEGQGHRANSFQKKMKESVQSVASLQADLIAQINLFASFYFTIPSLFPLLPSCHSSTAWPLGAWQLGFLTDPEMASRCFGYHSVTTSEEKMSTYLTPQRCGYQSHPSHTTSGVSPCLSLLLLLSQSLFQLQTLQHRVCFPPCHCYLIIFLVGKI